MKAIVQGWRAVWRSNPRPDTVRAWVALRVCLLAAFGGAHAWTAVALVVAWCALDYGCWFARRTP